MPAWGKCWIGLLALLVVAGCEESPSITLPPPDPVPTPSPPAISHQAPDFTLLDQDHRPITLGDYRGSWMVLYFYPKEDMVTCACDATEYTELLFRLHKIDAEICGITDAASAGHSHFIRKFGLPLTLLSDPQRQVSAMYGAWTTSMLGGTRRGHTARTTVLIDPNGMVRHCWTNVVPKGHVRQVRDKLSELQAAAVNGR